MYSQVIAAEVPAIQPVAGWTLPSEDTQSGYPAVCEVGTAPLHTCDTRYNTTQSIPHIPVKHAIELIAAGKKQGVYLKDWHFHRIVKSDDDYYTLSESDIGYSTPRVATVDWLGWWWSGEAATRWTSDTALHAQIQALCPAGQDDYRFAYVGAERSWTPLHCDVLHSWSWSVNVRGIKRWMFFPPGDEIPFQITPEQCIPDPRPDTDVPCAHGHAMHTWLAEHWPRQGSHATTSSPAVSSPPSPCSDAPLCPPACTLDRPCPWARALVFDSGPLEAVFVPPGWHHAVWNIIPEPLPAPQLVSSINRNWVPPHAAPGVQTLLLDEYVDICARLEDCRTPGQPCPHQDTEWHQLLRQVQQANSGISLQQWTVLLWSRAMHVLAQPVRLASTRNSGSAPSEPLIPAGYRGVLQGAGSAVPASGTCPVWPAVQVRPRTLPVSAAQEAHLLHACLLQLQQRLPLAQHVAARQWIHARDGMSGPDLDPDMCVMDLPLLWCADLWEELVTFVDCQPAVE